MAKNGKPAGDDEHVGRLIEIKGVVVDAVFPEPAALDLLGAADRAARRRAT